MKLVAEYMPRSYDDEEFHVSLFPLGSECISIRRNRSRDENSDSWSGDDDLNKLANDLEAEIENKSTRSDIEAYNKIGLKH
eukprot:4995684-Ditylum_brightwellii.AAC.1